MTTLKDKIRDTVTEILQDGEFDAKMMTDEIMETIKEYFNKITE